MALTKKDIEDIDRAVTVIERAMTQEWPMPPCVASGVNAAQAEQLSDFLEDRDCPTEVTPDGDPIYVSPEHRRKALKLRGMYDKSLVFDS
jgi:hypothetical protein